MKRAFLLTAAFFLLAMLAQSVAAAADGKGSNDQKSNDQGSNDQRSNDQAAWQRDLLAWRAKRAANLQAPEGWLSLIALGWLKKATTVSVRRKTAACRLWPRRLHTSQPCVWKKAGCACCRQPAVFQRTFSWMANLRKSRFCCPMTPRSPPS